MFTPLMFTAVLPTEGPRLGEMDATEKYLKPEGASMYVSLLKEIDNSVSKKPEPAGFNEAAGQVHNIVVESTSTPGNNKALKNLQNTCPLNAVFPRDGKP